MSEDFSKNKMESLRELYRIGCGPSSSHTIGPERACQIFKAKHADADCFKVVLYGSLAKTGKGHGTDVVIIKTLAPTPCEVVFDCENENIPHPNTFDVSATKKGRVVETERVVSVGGGKIIMENTPILEALSVYPHSSFDEIKEFCAQNKLSLWQYVEKFEGEEIREYLSTVWSEMKSSIFLGLNATGELPGGLKVQRKAKHLFEQEAASETPEIRENRIVCAYAFAVSEQNADCQRIVTAPTCGASGVLPAVLLYEQEKNGYSDEQVIKALEVASLMGNLIKTNGSISGAECGCQAEVGTACVMAAAAFAQLSNLDIEKIECAAEIAMEHHLGLTCDPICGLVQIPCIERNAVAAIRAINAVILANFLEQSRKITFDKVVKAMKETGRDMHSSYKETAEGGLAKIKFK